MAKNKQTNKRTNELLNVDFLSLNSYVVDDVFLVDVLNVVVVLDALVEHGHVGIDVAGDLGHLIGEDSQLNSQNK